MNNHQTPQPLANATPQPPQQQNNSDVQNPDQNNSAYDSNPFTLSFRGFGLFVKYAQGVFIATLIVGLLSGIGDIFNYNFPSNDSSSVDVTGPVSPSLPGGVDSGEIATAIAVGVILIISIILVVIVVSLVFQTLIEGTIAAGTVAASKYRKISFSEAFSEMIDRFGTLFFALAIATAKIIGGFFLFVVPGVRASLRYKAVPYIALENKDMNASEIIEESKRIYDQHLLEAGGIITAGSLIPFIGTSLIASGMTLSYQQIRAYKDAGQPKPKLHWLNWLLPLLILAFLALLAAFIVFIALYFINNSNL